MRGLRRFHICGLLFGPRRHARSVASGLAESIRLFTGSPFFRFVLGLLLAVSTVAGAGCGRVPRIIVLEDPLSADEHVALGVAYERKGELGPAAREYERALKKDKESFRARFNLGNVRLAEKMYDEASKMYREALALRPDDPEATNNLAWAAILSGKDREESLRLLASVISARDAAIPPPADGLSPSLLDTQGVLLFRLGRDDESKAAFDRAESECLAAISKVGASPDHGSGCTEDVLREIRMHREEMQSTSPVPLRQTPLIK